MMQIGMLWFDNTPTKTLARKVQDAAAYYRNKYQRAATVCFVNPADMQDGLTAVDGIAVKSNRSVMPNHFWMGQQ
jgi:hypothetical protein